MVDRDTLYKLEEADALKFLTSVTPGHLAKVYLGLPENVSGLRIVDLAAGGCSLVPQLIDAGADAHAVDPIYKHPNPEALLEECIQWSEKNWPAQYRAEARVVGNDTKAQFMQSFRTYRDNYHSDYMTRLPFPGNHFDYVTSLNGLLQLNESENIDLLECAMEEALRVLVPNGKLILAPFHNYESEFAEDDSHAEEHGELLKRIKLREDIKIQIEYDINRDPSEATMSRLIITKLTTS